MNARLARFYKNPLTVAPVLRLPELVGEPMTLQFSGVDGGECDAPLKITFPSDVDQLKARIDVQVKALNLAVEGEICQNLSDADRQVWRDFYSNKWLPFMAKKTPFFGSYGEWVTACSYSHMVDAYRDKFAKLCDDRLPGPGPVKGADTSTVDMVASSLQSLAIIAAVGGGIYVLATSGVLARFRK